MSFTKEESKKEIERLVDKYNKLIETEDFRKLTEEETKKDFILPLFHALNWDTQNSKEVSAEETISKKRVDYGFRIDGIPKFFLETKPLKEKLQSEYVEQAINYSWLKSTTWAVLTNFAELKVYNAEWKARGSVEKMFFELKSSEFIEKFDKLWLLSRDSFLQSELDKTAEEWNKKQKKTPVTPVMKQLFNDLMIWRQKLTKNISEKKINMENLKTEEVLDESVQRILDRLIFIRVCEDREIEPRTLMSKLREWKSIDRKGKLFIHMLNDVFREFDKNYNSKLFSKHICEDLVIDDIVLNDVIYGLYDSSDRIFKYDFAAIDADVLGSIYEEYLGYVLRKGKATENGMHRKEMGIYYTPTFVVDYIVKNTLGEILKEKGDGKIKILDPACGSGSFLIKAFDHLLEYHKTHSEKNLESFLRKIKILTDNIYGVDLDKQATEITQLNLLLRALEKRRILPMLQNNIKTGNSLIDNKKIAGDKAFDWNEEFKEIMDNSGFDIVIGNPPYGIIFKKNEKFFLEEHLSTFKRNNDIYVAFMEKAINLLKDGGLFSFIVPNTYLIGSYFENLKNFILEKTKIIKVIDFGINHVFKDPNVFNSIIILQKESNKLNREKNKIKFYSVPLLRDSDFFNLENFSLKSEIIQSQFHNFQWKPKNIIVEKMNKTKDKFIDDVCYVKDIGFNYWSIGRGKKRGGSIGSKVLYDGEKKNQKDIPYLKGRDIVQYGYVFGCHWLKHDYEKFLDKRVDIFRFTPEFLEISPKIIYRQTADRIIATIDFDKYYLDKTVHLIVPRENTKLNIFSLLGILNSKLMLYFYRDMVREKGRIFAQVKTVYIKKIPLRFDVKLEFEISKLVKTQLEHIKKLNELCDKKTDERIKIEEEIKSTDDEINELVYRLYGITEEEKRIIEDTIK